MESNEGWKITFYFRVLTFNVMYISKNSKHMIFCDVNG